jgi:hypothetical protein
LIAALLAMPACARFRHRTTAAAPATPPVASPVVRGAASGLELWWWVVTDPHRIVSPNPSGPSNPGEAPKPPLYTIREPGNPLEQTLLPYLDRPTPFSDAVKAKWKASGLRVIAVPINELERVQASLRLTGPVQRQWFGEVSTWTDIVRGPQFHDPRIVMLGDKPEELPAGRLRLLARCWTYPDSGGQGAPLAALRMELVPHFEPEETDRSRLEVAALGKSDPTDASRLYTELSAGLEINTHRGEPDAFLIVPDRPDADWKSPRDPLTEDGDSGPQPQLPPTLGETMLSVPASKDSPRSRAVIILIPRLPQKFELLGR